MPEDPDYQPLYVRTEEDIRDAMNAYTNQGLDPDDDRYVSTREIDLFYICTQPAVVQLAQQWDALSTEVGASAFIISAWGDKLDLAAAQYGVERNAAVPAKGTVTFTSDGVAPVLIGAGFKVAGEQTDPDIEPPVFVTTTSATILPGLPDSGSHDIPVVALDAGIEGNVSAGAITVPLDDAPGLLSITNANPTLDGADVESDEALKTKTIFALLGSGGVPNVAYYTRKALDEPGVGRVTVVPAASGAGTVQVIIATAVGDPTSAGIVTSLQTRMDPVAGMGSGEAPIDHSVTVVTVAGVAINVAATIVPESGYTTLGLTGSILSAVTTYVNSLMPGDDVVRNRVRQSILDVTGVHDVSAITLNTTAADIAISTTPPQIARIGTIVLT